MQIQIQNTTTEGISAQLEQEEALLDSERARLADAKFYYDNAANSVDKQARTVEVLRGMLKRRQKAVSIAPASDEFFPATVCAGWEN